MYVVLTWKPQPGAQAAAVRNRIVSKMQAYRMTNIMNTFEQQLIANIGQGRGSADAFDLEFDLRRNDAPGRFTFTLFYVRRGQEILHSNDLNGKSASFIGVSDF